MSDETAASVVNGHEPTLVRDCDGQRDSVAGAGEYAGFHCNTTSMCNVMSQLTSNGTVRQMELLIV